ncbi:MAG: hypothetical protein AABW90_02085 [Nanoarchaeota archaeon]|mgnify:CR=1 FL=1
MNEIELKNLFMKAARTDRFLTEDERQIDGALIFKRKALGLCGNQSIKTLDEMAQLLCDTRIASSVKEGRELTPSLIDITLKYSIFKYITIDEVRDGKDNIRYQIKVYTSNFL